MLRYLSLLLLMCTLIGEGHMIGMEEVEELLNMESNIDLKNSNQLILLIGSTGTGKSTLAKFLINDPSLQRVNVGITNFIYKDNGTISNNTRKSMTILPNVYRDPETKEVIVDCPGFSDTREPKYEIANAFFIKKVLEHPKKLKIVVTENHFSLVEGSDRFGLKRLLIALAELIPNIERFHGSVALVSTKASPRGNPEYAKSNLLRFLANYKHYLEDDLDSKTLQSVINVLDVLTGNPPGNNIGFFWKPTIMNNQSVDDLMNNCKNDMRSLIFNQLTWADNTNASYHYSVSEESRLFITQKIATANLASTVEELKRFFANLKLGAQNNIFTFKSLKEGVDFMKRLQNELSFVSSIALQSVHDISNVTQRLAAVTQVKEFNTDVFKYLATKVAFFKTFGFDVLDQLNKVMLKELGYFRRWLTETLQNAERLKVLEERIHQQVKEAKEAQENATKTATEAELRHKQVVEEAKRVLDKTDRESAARVAAARSAAKTAAENANLAEKEVTQSIRKLEASMKESKDIFEHMVRENKNAAKSSPIANFVMGLFYMVANFVSKAPKG